MIVVKTKKINNRAPVSHLLPFPSPFCIRHFYTITQIDEKIKRLKLFQRVFNIARWFINTRDSGEGERRKNAPLWVFNYV